MGHQEVSYLYIAHNIFVVVVCLFVCFWISNFIKVIVITCVCMRVVSEMIAKLESTQRTIL